MSTPSLPARRGEVPPWVTPDHAGLSARWRPITGRTSNVIRWLLLTALFTGLFVPGAARAGWGPLGFVTVLLLPLWWVCARVLVAATERYALRVNAGEVTWVHRRLFRTHQRVVPLPWAHVELRVVDPRQGTPRLTLLIRPDTGEPLTLPLPVGRGREWARDRAHAEWLETRIRDAVARALPPAPPDEATRSALDALRAAAREP